ncbi:hypothetical protein AB1N83_007904 [Pleurotus pulmonarius]
MNGNVSYYADAKSCVFMPILRVVQLTLGAFVPTDMLMVPLASIICESSGSRNRFPLLPHSLRRYKYSLDNGDSTFIHNLDFLHTAGRPMSLDTEGIISALLMPLEINLCDTFIPSTLDLAMTSHAPSDAPRSRLSVPYRLEIIRHIFLGYYIPGSTHSVDH